MTNRPLTEFDTYFVAKNKDGHIWVSPSGKSKFGERCDLVRAWRRAIKAASANGLPTIGNAKGLKPLKVIKPNSRRNNKPTPKMIWPPFNDQNLYTVCIEKTETAKKLDRAKELLRLCSGHVTEDIKEQIVKFLGGEL